jgi:hypothetical protein
VEAAPADHQVGAGSAGGDQRRRLARIVLAIAIDQQHPPVAATDRPAAAGDDGGALAAIGAPQDGGAGTGRHPRGLVAAAVVDHQHGQAEIEHAAHHRGDAGRLVVGGDDRQQPAALAVQQCGVSHGQQPKASMPIERTEETPLGLVTRPLEMR